MTQPSNPSPSRDTVDIVLDTPITRGDLVLQGIALRRPKAGELRGIALADVLRLDVSALQQLLPRITSPALTTHDVQQLELPDLMAIGTEVVSFFLTKSQREAASPDA
ncbi:phage tail assembly protein [Lysobacter arvi]|uniref:Phage tail assembly protein n=1 Tax=Lysobacter arvi TaxID=3038776 RepID=A0ABU1CBC5_9GAMM|nr:phage tail assembly protein [Lysobacter arvi]MDR0182415.1 phage tail assembly protein [Lysobacter arvi]